MVERSKLISSLGNANSRHQTLYTYMFRAGSAHCHQTLFLLTFFFVHFRPNFTSHSLPHLSPLCLSLLCYSPYAFMLTKEQQEHDSIGITGHRTTCLLGYRHPETVLLWFLLTRILCWNLLCRHRTLPPLKVPDFPDTEHK